MIRSILGREVFIPYSVLVQHGIEVRAGTQSGRLKAGSETKAKWMKTNQDTDNGGRLDKVRLPTNRKVQ